MWTWLCWWIKKSSCLKRTLVWSPWTKEAPPGLTAGQQRVGFRAGVSWYRARALWSHVGPAQAIVGRLYCHSSQEISKLKPWEEATGRSHVGGFRVWAAERAGAARYGTNWRVPVTLSFSHCSLSRPSQQEARTHKSSKYDSKHYQVWPTNLFCLAAWICYFSLDLDPAAHHSHHFYH